MHSLRKMHGKIAYILQSAHPIYVLKPVRFAVNFRILSTQNPVRFALNIGIVCKQNPARPALIAQSIINLKTVR